MMKQAIVCMLILASGCIQDRSGELIITEVDEAWHQPVHRPERSSSSTAFASCSNPLNHPADAELQSQYADFRRFLGTNQIQYVAMASLSAGFSIPADDQVRASLLIRQAQQAEPERWSRFKFNLKDLTPNKSVDRYDSNRAASRHGLNRGSH